LKLKKIKIIYIVSNINKALAFEWIAEKLDKSRFDLIFVLLNPGKSDLEEYLISSHIKVYLFPYTGKKDIPGTFWKILKILRKEKGDRIHTHLFEASLLGLAAGKIAGVSKRIVTRHHGNQHHAFFPRAVYYDRIINSLATTIVAPSQSVKNILVSLEGVNSAKVKVVHHGFDLAYFDKPQPQLVQMLREKYNSANKRPVIGVISRYTELKGLQYIIPAFKKLLDTYPNGLLVLANAGGDYSAQIGPLLKELPESAYVEIPFEKNIAGLYPLFDVFVHTPVEPASEAFGQTYVEALASGTPSVFTLSGVAAEFIVDRQNALVVPFRSAEAIHDAVLTLLKDEFLRSGLIKRGKQDVCSTFALSKMIKRLEDIYAD
jgi:glycosyltransferase involved in cell wall biosynthesis